MIRLQPDASAWLLDQAKQIEAKAKDLLEHASAAGLHVEITPRPLQPLAMRNYELAITVWPRREA